jgi:predicted ABC-type ATPase
MPQIIVVGGPNGAGKSTFAYNLLLSEFGISEFVNADTIAKGISAYNYEDVAFEAGRIMLQRLRQLFSKSKDFSFETTLAAKSFIPFLRDAKLAGYKITIIFFWVESSELAIDRIKQRKIEGGHFIEEEIVKRRYKRSIYNFRNSYIKLADDWMIFDNTKDEPILVAKKINDDEDIYLNNLFDQIMTSKIKEPREDYLSDPFYKAVKEAFAREMEKRRKLGLPIIISRNGKIIDINPQPKSDKTDKKEGV